MRGRITILFVCLLAAAGSPGCKSGQSEKAGATSSEERGLVTSDPADATYALELEIAPDGVYREGSLLVETEGWSLSESREEGAEIASLRSELTEEFGESGSDSTAGAGARLLIRLHPLVRYDVWSRVLFTVDELGPSAVYAALAGEGFQDFGVASPRHFQTTGSGRTGTGMELKGLLGRGADAGQRRVQQGDAGSRDAGEGAEAQEVLSVHVRHDGFHVRTPGGLVEPVEGCSESDATICTSISPSAVESIVTKARAAAAGGDVETARKRAGELRDAYSFRQLYGVVAQLDENHPELGRLRVAATPAIPSFLMTAVADHLQVVLPQRSYGTRSSYQVARAQASGRERALFPTVVLGEPLE